MKKISTNLLKVVLFSLLFFVCLVAYPATFYFSSSLGDDTRSLAQAQNENTPWKSIQKLNSIFSNLQPGDKILFKNGDTFYGTLTITKSGTTGAPISFGSYGSGEKPIITSLVSVSNWTSKGGNIYESNVGVADALNIVLLDGKVQAMGRFPNADVIRKGYLTISSTSGGNIVSSELQAPVNFTGGEVVIRKNNWIIDRHYINQHSGTSINYNTTGSNYSPKVGFGFFIQNHPGTLDQNGEWFFNKQNKTLQFYYDKGDPSFANIQVALNNQVIDIKQGVSNITFSNLSILGANENLVSISSSSNISFVSSELKFAGRNGIHAVVTTNFILQNSLVEDMFNSSLFFQWQDVNMKILNNTFNRTHVFPGMGRNGDMNGNTIYMSETSGNGHVENNKILNSGYQGINFNGNNTIIKNNLVDMFCFVKDDGAGIYTYTGSSNTTLTNRKVINNIVINGIGAVDGTKPYGPTDFPYVEGIYMDDNASGVEISGNTVANVASSGIYIHNSRSIDIFQNNIYNVGKSILFVHDNLGDANRNINMKNNNFLAKNTNQSHVFVRSKLNDVAMMGTFDENVFAKPVNESNTITLDTPAKNGLIDLQNWKDSYGLDKNSTRSPVDFDPNKMDIEEFILFDYNYSNSIKSLPLAGTYADLKGNVFSGSVSIPAYSSVLLLKTGSAIPIENVAPTVSITSPATNAQFIQGDNISITSVAADTDGTIAKVEFYNGNALLGTDSTSPYSFAWDNLPIGSFSLTAKATDDMGTETVSEIVNINVVEKPNVSPTVSITAPTLNATFFVGDNINITANAADPDGTIAKVEFYHGNTLLGTDTTSPYSFTWANLPFGSFGLIAKATDNKGTATVSETVNINVVEKPNIAPTVAITAPKANEQFIQGENINITANADDSDGTIAKVEFYHGNTLLGTDTTSPYSFTWTNLPFGSFGLTAKAIDNKGAATVCEMVNINVIEKISRSPYGGTAAIIPGTVEAENYDIGGQGVTYYDVDPGNNGGIYRADDVDIGTAVEGGYTLGWMNLNEWLEYTVNITTAGAYNLDARVASPGEGGSFHIECNGVDVTGSLTIPATGGWDTWASVKKTGINLPAGTHVLRFVLDTYGVNGYWGNLNSMQFTLPNVAPTVTITAPKANDQFIQGENISITANADDADGTIAKVEFYYGNTLLGTDTTSPYSFTWANLPIGSYALTAKATDNKGTSTVSSVVNINVVEKPNLAPTVAITAPKANDRFIQGENITITANAADADGTIAKVEFYYGNTLLGTDTTSPYNFTWTNLPVGSFALTAKATDNKGTSTVSSVVNINVIEKANIAPTVAISSPAQNASFFIGDNINITANAADADGTIAKVEFYYGNTLLGTDTTSPYSFTWTNLPLGSFALTAKATDNKGTATVSSVVNINVVEKPNIAPTVAITTPKANDQFIQDENINITANAADADGTITKVEFYYGNTLLGTDTTSPYSFTWDNLPIGSFALTAKAIDNKGAATVSEMVNINVVEKPNVAPTVAITAPKANDQFIQGENITITANAADADGTIAKVEFYYGNTLLGTDNTSPYSFTWANLPIGSFVLTAKATDNKGTATVSSVVNINVVEKPNVAPTVNISSPANNASFFLGDNINITVNAADADGTIAKVEFYYGITLLGTDTTSPYSFTWANLPIGSFALTAKATDNKGTATVSSVVNINVVEKPNVAPTVAITAPKANDKFFQGENINITANAADADGTIAKVEFYNGNTLLGTDTSSPYSFNWANLPIGSFALTAKATDNKGTSTVSSVVNINVVEKPNVAPTVAITAPKANDQFIQGENISITANAADADGTIAKVEFYNGNTLLGTDTTSPYSFNWANLPIGSFALTAKATDNKGTATVSSFVNINVVEKPNVAPTVAITAPKANGQFIQGENISITANAADADGTIAKVEFYNGNTLLGTDTTSPYNFTWTNLPVGSFALTAKATDNKGTSTVSSVVNINVIEKANIAPTVAISSPANNASFFMGDNINITANAADADGTIIKVEFYNGNTLLGTDTTSPYSFTWASLPIGSFVLTAKATDNKGTATVSSVVNINVVEKQNVAPTVNISSPANNSSFFLGDNINITANAADADGTIAKVEFYDGNTLLGTDTTSPYSFNWANLPIGSFALTAKATDNKGTATVSSVVNINVVEKPNVAPTVAITAPKANDQFIQGENINITANAADADGTIAKVEFYYENTLLGTDTTSPYSFTWANLPIGSYALTAKATDNKGTATVSSFVNINIVEKPNVAPTVAITAPKANDQFIQGENINITANAADADGTIAKVEFYYGNTLLGTDTTSPYSFTWTNLPLGSFALTAKATDNKGMATVSSVVNINVVEKPNVAPTVAITAPKANDQFIQGENISITANAADADGTITKVEFYYGNTLLGTDTTSPYSFTWTNLPLGSFALTAKATDNKGTATVSDTVNIIVQAGKINPKIRFKTPSTNTEYFRYEDINFEVDLEAPDSEIVKVEYFRNNILIGSISEAPYDLTWRASVVGNLNIRAIATDGDGSTATSETLTVRVKNNTPPSISIISPVNNSKFNLGNNINIEVKASDSDGSVKKVEFFNEEQLIGEATQEPFNLELRDLATGKYVFKAKATDDRGASTISSTVSIEVFKEESAINPVEIILPEIIIVTPVNNQEYDAGSDVEVMVMFQGSAERVKKVEYYSGSQLIGFSTVSPFDFIWLKPGSDQYLITARVIGEDSNNYKLSESVSIRVKEKTQTIFQITDPLKDAVFNAGQNISMAVDLPEGDNPIERVDYYRGNTRLGSSTSYPYNFSWDKVQAGNYNLIAQLLYQDGSQIISIPVPIKVLKRNQSVVRLVSKYNKREILTGENLDLNVELLEFENEIEVVDYILNGQKLGSSKENPYGFQWQNIPEGNHQIVARAIDAGGDSYYSEPLNFSVLRDIKDIQLEYVIGPNPTADYLNVIFKNLDGNYAFEFRVVSMNGNVLKSFGIIPDENTVTLDVADLKNGVYILQITANGNEVSSRRFVKK